MTRCWAFVLWVCVSACQTIPLSVLARNPHKELVRKISHETGRRRGKGGPREERTRQSAEVGRRDQLTEQVSQEMRVGQRGDQSTEVRKVAVRICWPPDAGLTKARRWVSILSCFVEASRKYMPVIACKCTESCTNVSQTSPLLRLELTQARVFVLLFFHTLGCVFCVLIKKCEIPWAGDEKNHLSILMAMSSLVGWDSGDRLAVYCHSSYDILSCRY